MAKLSLKVIAVLILLKLLGISSFFGNFHISEIIENKFIFAVTIKLVSPLTYLLEKYGLQILKKALVTLFIARLLK